jgi:ligand-binding sensor domain-containing protein/DNA-binding CsgD family transcriptional regulator
MKSYQLKISSILLMIIFLFSISLKLYSNESERIEIKNFSKNDYRAAYQNWAIERGNDGFIYIANNSGLLIFDGVSWELFTNEKITNLRAVRQDSESSIIYTAGYNELGYWKRDEFGSLQYFSLRDRCPQEISQNEEFWNIEIVNNKVIFQSFMGIFIYENDTIQIIRPKGFITGINNCNNQVFVTIKDYGIYSLEDTTLVPFMEGEFFKNKFIVFVLQQKENLIIGTSKHGIFKYNGKEPEPIYEDQLEFLSDNSINAGIINDNSELIIGTIRGGLIIFKPNGEYTVINSNNDLQNNTVLDISSYHDQIWLATDHGVSIIQSPTRPDIDIHKIDKVGAVYSVAFFEGKMYLGTNQGLYRKLKDSPDNKFELVQGTQGQVWDCKVFDNWLIIGHNSGTFAIQNNKIDKISNFAGGFSLARIPKESDSFLQSTYTKILKYRLIDNNWQVDEISGEFADLIRYIEADHLNNLWAGHRYRSVYRLQMNSEYDSIYTVSYFGENSIFKKDYGIGVFKINGQIVFTTGDSIFIFDSIIDSIINYKYLNKKLGKYSSSQKIVGAQNNHYWFINDNSLALFKIRRDSIQKINEYPLSLFNYDIIEDFKNIIPIDDKKAVLCLASGYAFINTNIHKDSSGMKKTSLIVNKISISGKDQNQVLLNPTSQHFKIPANANSLKIQFSYPEYRSKDIRYSYQIEGYNSIWSTPQSSPIITLNRIPPGQYKINTKAINESNNSSPLYTIHLEVQKQIYFSLLAFIFYFAAIIFIILLVRNRSVKRIREKEKAHLEIKERELVKLKNENLRNELSLKSIELATSTMSIIKKNEFLLELKDLLKIQKRELGNRYPDKFYQRIIGRIDRNISKGDDWKIFEANIKNANQFFVQKIIQEYPNLTSSDLKLCTYLRMNLSSKEIAPLMRVSTRAIENHRYRLRKKFKLSKEEKLIEFILSINI